MLEQLIAETISDVISEIEVKKAILEKEAATTVIELIFDKLLTNHIQSKEVQTYHPIEEELFNSAS